MEKREHLPILSRSEHIAMLSVLWGLFWRDKLLSFTFRAIAWFSCTAIGICRPQDGTVMAFALGLVADFATSVLATFVYLCTARKVHLVLFDNSLGKISNIDFGDAVSITLAIWWRQVVLSVGIGTIVVIILQGIFGAVPIVGNPLGNTHNAALLFVVFQCLPIIAGLAALWIALLWVSGVECRGRIIDFV